MSSLIRTMCRNESAIIYGRHKRGLPPYCEVMSRKKGKNRHVSRNTPTPNRLSTRNKDLIGYDPKELFRRKKKIW